MFQSLESLGNLLESPPPTAPAISILFLLYPRKRYRPNRPLHTVQLPNLRSDDEKFIE